MNPAAAQICIFPQFVAPRGETLVLKEKLFSLSGDSFDIMTVEKVPVFKVAGKALSLSSKKTFTDMQGNELFVLKKEHLHIHSTYHAENAAGQKLFEVKSKFSLGKSKAAVTFNDPNGVKHVLLMKGNFFDTKSEIIDEATDAVVATIDRKLFNLREFFGGQQTYALSVAPGVDMAMMCAACVCFDEMQNEGNN